MRRDSLPAGTNGSPAAVRMSNNYTLRTLYLRLLTRPRNDRFVGQATHNGHRQLDLGVGVFFLFRNHLGLIPRQARQRNRRYLATLRRFRRLFTNDTFIRILAVTRSNRVNRLVNTTLDRRSSNHHRILRVRANVGRLLKCDRGRRVLGQMRST